MTGELRRTIFEEQYGRRFKTIAGDERGAIVQLALYDQYILAVPPTVSGTTVLTLPPAVEAAGREYYIELAGEQAATDVLVLTSVCDAPLPVPLRLKADGEYVLLRSVGQRWLLASTRLSVNYLELDGGAAGDTAALGLDDQYVIATAPTASGSLALTLPPVADAVGREYYIALAGEQAATNVTIDSNEKAPATLDTVTLTADGDYVLLRSVGQQWVPVSSRVSGVKYKQVDGGEDGATVALGLDDQYVIATAPTASGSLALTLPPVADAVGREYYIALAGEQAATNVTIDSNEKAPATLDTVTLTADGDYVLLRSVGQQWVPVSSRVSGVKYKQVDGGEDGATVALGLDDQYVIATAPTASGSLALTLPPVADAVGREYYIALAGEQAATNVTIDSNEKAPATLDTVTLTADGDYVLLRSVGQRWVLASSRVSGVKYKQVDGGEDGDTVALGLDDQYVTASPPTTSGTTALTLPPVADAVGRDYYIELANAQVATSVTVDSFEDSPATLATVTLAAAGDYVLLRSTGARWIEVCSVIDAGP